MVSDASDLGDAVVDLLKEPDRARAAAERGQAALLRHRGSGERTCALIEAAILAASTGAL